MVTIIHLAKSLSHTLRYNDRKVEQGRAELIHAENFLVDTAQLDHHVRYYRLKRLDNLQQRANKKTIHIKIGFHPTDKLPDEILRRISDRYMQKIGFGDQPYIVYRHDDSRVRHLHIISTLVQNSGKLIQTHGLPKKLSMLATAAIEQEFNLAPAKSDRGVEYKQLKPAEVRQVKYPEKPVRTSIQETVFMIIREYQFASFQEFNALLRLYNIQAERGRPGTKTFLNHGIYYKIVDKEGKAVCKPLMASAIPCKPTLKNLEKKFEEAKEMEKIVISYIHSKIEWALWQNPGDAYRFYDSLKKNGIDIMVQSTNPGSIELTYIDHGSRTTLSGEKVGNAHAVEKLLSPFLASTLDLVHSRYKRQHTILQPFSALASEQKGYSKTSRQENQHQHIRRHI